jgi:hypothetical protein
MRKAESGKKYENLSPSERSEIGIHSKQQTSTQGKRQCLNPALHIRFGIQFLQLLPTMQTVLKNKENSEGRYQGKGTQNQERKHTGYHESISFPSNKKGTTE